MGGTKAIPKRAIAVFLLAAGIGVVGGLLGVGFQLALDWLQNVMVGKRGPDQQLFDAVRERLSPLWTVLVPTLGGIGAGLIQLLVRRRTAPFGISAIIGLVALRKGTIRLRDSFVQILSSACSIGSGASIGKEGANVQVSATVAAELARAFRVSARTRSVLLGCGVAAGVAGSYNAPIAGAIFVMEAVLGNFAMDVFAPIVVSSVLATMLRRALLDDRHLYGADLPMDLGALSPHLVLTALLLGVLCGFGGVLFRVVLRHGKRAFRRLPLPKPLLLGCGGLCVGLIGLFRPEVWGNGFEVIRTITAGGAVVPLGMVLSLCLWKVVATTATAGSGALGGIFTPHLVVGAAFGAVFAIALEWLSPGPVDLERHEQITFTFVGMAGLCAAMAHAPVTAVVLVFELTGHYELTLPIMLCSVTASIVARMLVEDSYYTESLRAKGETLPTGVEELALKTTYVRDVMRKDALTVRDVAGFDEVMHLLANHRGDTLYVVDDRAALVGRIQLQDVKNFINDPTLGSVVIAADLTRPAVVATREESLAAILPHFDDPELGEVAVVESNGQRRLLGRVRQQDIIAGFSSEVLGQHRRAQFRASTGRKSGVVDLPPGWELATVPVPDVWSGLAIDNLPADVLSWLVPVLVVRPDGTGGTERLPATPELVLREGAELLALCRGDDLRRWRASAAETE